jgi:hypothetical protein
VALGALEEELDGQFQRNGEGNGREKLSGEHLALELLGTLVRLVECAISFFFADCSPDVHRKWWRSVLFIFLRVWAAVYAAGRGWAALEHEGEGHFETQVQIIAPTLEFWSTWRS